MNVIDTPREPRHREHHKGHEHEPEDLQHAVRFYSAKAELFDAVAAYLAEGVARGRPIVVIARPEHVAGIHECLTRRGIDVDALVAAGEAVFLDARDTIDALLAGDLPQRDLFLRAVTPVLTGFGDRIVVAYGEMVDILWKEGRTTAALRLEDLWSELQEELPFHLLCAYQELGGGVGSRSICEAHNAVELRAADDGTLVADLAQRKRVERDLRRALRDLKRTERHLSDFVNNAPVALHSVAADGRIEWANAAELRLLGYRDDEYVGRNIRELYVDADVIEDLLARLARGEELHDFPARVRAKDGGVRHVLVTTNARVTEGKIDSTRCSMRDVTESVVAEQRLAELFAENSRGRARAELVLRVAGAANHAVKADDVFDTCLSAMLDLGVERCSILARDASGTMRFRAWRGLSEAYRKDVEGHNPWNHTSVGLGAFEPIVVADVATARDEHIGGLAEAFRREAIGTVAFIPLVATGRLIGKFTLGWTKPSRISDEDLSTAVAIASHVAAALVRFKVLDELQQTVRFQETFTGMLAHDLRNPLNAIILGARSIETQPARDATKLAQRILRSGERMSRMIDQLLDFTRVRLGGGIPVRREPADVLSVLRRILEEHSADGRRIDLSHSGDTRGEWDEDRLAQVFSNLVGNALLHGHPDHPIAISVVGEAGGVSAEITNRGAIPADLVPTLFEPLSGAPKNRAGARGLGLGLFISRQVVEAHRGRIDVATHADSGTCFRIWLPRDAP